MFEILNTCGVIFSIEGELSGIALALVGCAQVASWMIVLYIYDSPCANITVIYLFACVTSKGPSLHFLRHDLGPIISAALHGSEPFYRRSRF